MRVYREYQYHDVRKRGTIRNVSYCTTNESGAEVRKYANVYLPYGYDETDAKYPIVYMMHGGGGSPDAFLDSCQIKNMLDSAFASGEAEPMIFVFPTYYNEEEPVRADRGTETERDRTKFFQKELVNDLIPAVEGSFRTYADAVTPEGIRASRMHRAFGGFSMGGCTTWYTLTMNLQYFGVLIPLSGDCWEVTIRGGEFRPEETAELIGKRIREQGYTKEEFRIFAATGDQDSAYTALTPLVAALQKDTELFTFSTEAGEGNLNYLAVPDKYHRYETIFEYIWYYLPVIFRNAET